MALMTLLQTGSDLYVGILALKGL